MKRVSTYCAVLIVLLSFIPTKVKATHCAGAELLYEWVSDSTYRIYYKFYRDCVGIPEDDSEQCCITNKCNALLNFSVNLGKITGILPNGRLNGTEVNKQCPGAATTCSYIGSPRPGYIEWWYSGLVTLPMKCNNWEFSTSPVTRNVSITNLANIPGTLWSGASLDNLHFQGDSSPYFSNKPILYACDNIPYIYNNGAVDPDGDSLYFQLEYPSNANCGDPFGTAPDTFNQTGLPVSSQYNLFNNPLQCNHTFALDHRTGQMTFTPSLIQVAVINMLVNSYRNGLKIGHVMRDVQMTVNTCTGPQPVITVNTTSLTGAVLDSYGDITACAGTSFHFTFKATINNPAGILSLTENHSAAAPGSSLVITNYASDSVNGSFSWSPTINDTGLKIFTVTVYDSTCNPSTTYGYKLEQTYTLPIHIYPVTKAFYNKTIVAGDTVHLSVTGGSSFSWSVLPGGSTIASLSCTTCNNPVASPTTTTKYVVTSNLTGSCKNKDTVTITVSATPPVNKISGSVTISSATGNPSSPMVRVWRIVHNTTANTLVAIDSTTVTGSAYAAAYQFINEPAGTYLIKAALLNGPTSGTGPAPSYDSSSLYWDSAKNVVYSGSGLSPNNNIIMPQGTVTTGPGFIGGNITSGANKGTHVTGSPVYNMLVFLKNAANHLDAFTYTDGSGNYSFSNLAAGYYTVYPEAGTYKTTPTVNVNVSSTSPHLTGIDFTEHTLSKTITPKGVGITAVVYSNRPSVYPNPTTGIVYLKWDQLQEENADITITDIVGRKIATTHLDISNNGLTQLDLSPCQPGLYFINLRAGGVNYTDKVLLQR